MNPTTKVFESKDSYKEKLEGRGQNYFVWYKELLLMFNRVKRFCVVAGYLSEKVFITYYDVSLDAMLTSLDILHAALRYKGEYDGYDNIEVLVDDLRKKFKVILTIFDEAEKWYRECTAPEEEIRVSRQIIG
jgi:hypothetical protein